MEKAILKTLIYADIFDYPLKVYEIHKWLIGRKANLRQAEAAIDRLVKSSKLKVQSDYYFLSKSTGLVGKRKRKEKQSAKYLKKAQVLASLLKVIPWIKLVGISGGLALDNAFKKDDIDLFIVTGKNRLWICRLLILGLLSLTGQRRKRLDLGRKIAGKLCINILLEEDRLEQKSKDIFIAHELLQMRVLWQRGNVYSRYLMDNEWAFKFLPNWVTNRRLKIKDLRFKMKNHKSLIVNHKSLLDQIEFLAKSFQLWYMQSPKGQERITDGALYFHPNDIRQQILTKYQQKLNSIISP